MAINGSVLAFICAQSTGISKAERAEYLVGEWRSSGNISKYDIKNMLEVLFEIQNYCGNYTAGKYPDKLIAKISAKDASLRSGNNFILRKFRFLLCFIGGIKKLKI